LGEGLQKTIKEFRVQFSSFLKNLEEQVNKSSSLSFVDKDKVANAIQKFRTKISIKEIQEWAKHVDEAISGDKFIICLQKFDFSEEEKIEVILCPNCSYAGHSNHFETWLEKKASCPMCRGKINKKSLVKGSIISKDDEIVFSNII
jgi:uncharacterized protein (DUF2225 family)